MSEIPLEEEKRTVRLDAWQLACVFDGLRSIGADGVLEAVSQQVEGGARQEDRGSGSARSVDKTCGGCRWFKRAVSRLFYEGGGA